MINSNKAVFVNLDDAIQEEKTRMLTRYTFSQKDHKVSVFIDTITANPFVTIQTLGNEIKSHLIGLYNANNINAAITIGNHFGVTIQDIKEAIESYIPDNNRSQMIVKGTNEIILDAYNANPSSMAVALENFIQLDKPNKVIIIGDMFELGEESIQEHKAIVEMLTNQAPIQCYFVGKDFYANAKEQSNFHFYNSFEDFSLSFSNVQLEKATILIKGSRGMALERTLEYL